MIMPGLCFFTYYLFEKRKIITNNIHTQRGSASRIFNVCS